MSGNGVQDPVGVAVVGLGYWGPNLVRNLHEVSEAEVVWACDRRQEALDALARRYPAIRRTTRDGDSARARSDARPYLPLQPARPDDP